MIRQRALQRDALLDGLRSRDMAAIATVCKRLPENAELASYLPLMDHELLINTDFVKDAKWYLAQGGTDRRVTAYVEWCLRHSRTVLPTRADLLVCRQVSKELAPTLSELCSALRLLKDTADDESLKKSAGILKKLLTAFEGTPALAFARQPYASPGLMLQKCVLLAKHMQGQTFDRFVAKLEQAHAMQEASPAALQQSLTKGTFDERELRDHVMILHARALTNPTARLIPREASSAQLKVMHDKLVKSRLGRDTETIELLAFRSVTGIVRHKMGRRLHRENPVPWRG
ncbi:hypothetical protein [Hydrogenophaga sp.]|uniref:hypothetical protein n=1 Tax=Hydrogenophaga sp. TaxID=1904254 RepID=UPI00272872EC|nr:hypothetical protein [Hydrogenophaga sp.]MDO9434075.1 hypothetical protein [Hydrogenophaga sp.]